MSIIPETSLVGLRQAIQEDNYDLTNLIALKLGFSFNKIWAYVIDANSLSVADGLISNYLYPSNNDFKAAIYFHRYEIANFIIDRLSNESFIFKIKDVTGINNLNLIQKLYQIGYKFTENDIYEQLRDKNLDIVNFIYSVQPDLFQTSSILTLALNVKAFELAEDLHSLGIRLDSEELLEEPNIYNIPALNWIINHGYQVNFDTVLLNTMLRDDAEMFQYIYINYPISQDMLDNIAENKDKFWSIVYGRSQARSRSPSPTRRVK